MICPFMFDKLLSKLSCQRLSTPGYLIQDYLNGSREYFLYVLLSRVICFLRAPILHQKEKAFTSATVHAAKTHVETHTPG